MVDKSNPDLVNYVTETVMPYWDSYNVDGIQLDSPVVPVCTDEFLNRAGGAPHEGFECYTQANGYYTSELLIQRMIEKGANVGGVKIKMVRPFPSREIYQAVQEAKKVVVIERDLSFGVGGIIAQELRASLYHQEIRPPLFGFVSGLGGRDITPDLIEEALVHALEHSHPEGDVLWLGLKR